MTENKPAPTPAAIGDVLPNMVLPDASGSGVGMSQQTRAGRWLVLVFLEPDILAAQMDALTLARNRVEACEGQLFSVLFSEPNATLAGVDLFDRSKGGATFLLGAQKSGVAVISPEGQLAGQFEIDALDAAVAHCEAAYNSDTPDTLSLAAPVLFIPDVLDPALCRHILDFWQGAPKSKDAVASAQQGNEAVYSAIKRRTDAIIPDGELFESIRRSMTRRVLPMIDRVFRMQVASMEALRVGCYSAEDNGAFGRHRDNTTPHTAHRRFAMSVNLNADDYEGGDIRFPEFGRKTYRPATGGAVIFSCSLLHEALPVTSGQRFGMFTFFTDAAGLEMEKRAARERDQASRIQPAPQA